MSFLSGISAQTASRLLALLVVGSLSAAGTGAWTAAVLTGSTNPADWVAAKEHAASCSRVVSDRDPNCSLATAKQQAELQLALLLEDRARQLREAALSLRVPPAEHHSNSGTTSVSSNPSTRGDVAESEAGDD